MKICLVAEGCYPYKTGGMSSWIQNLMQSFPDTEFILLAVTAKRGENREYACKLPVNLREIYEVYLEDYEWEKPTGKRRKANLNKKEYEALRRLMLGKGMEWDVIFGMFRRKKISVDDFLMGADFLHIATEVYKIQYPQIVFSDFLWTLRSIYLPLFLVLRGDLPKADLYHCVSTGYAGVLGSMAKHLYGCGLIVSEHGIYTREREEELIHAKWMEGIYKNIWIDQFKKMSNLAYGRADKVTCLYEKAKEQQMDLGCPEDKIEIIPNGVDVKRFVNTMGKRPEDEGMIHVGAVARVVPIKDIKTLLQAFSLAKERVDNLKLWIIGPADEDKKYAQECSRMVESLQLKDVVFTGKTSVKAYLGRMDFTVLTSISEGQPLSILESYAAHRPVIATDVGNCRELIYGGDDEFGDAGILTHIMNVSEIADAIVFMAENEEMRLEMGENGNKRVTAKYNLTAMKKRYGELYNEFSLKRKK